MTQIDRFLQQLEIGRRTPVDESETVPFARLVVFRILHKRNIFRIRETEQEITLVITRHPVDILLGQTLQFIRRERQPCPVFTNIPVEFLIDLRQSGQNLAHTLALFRHQGDACIFISADIVLSPLPFFIVIDTDNAHIPVQLSVLVQIRNETLNLDRTGIRILTDIRIRRYLAQQCHGSLKIFYPDLQIVPASAEGFCPLFRLDRYVFQLRDLLAQCFQRSLALRSDLACLRQRQHRPFSRSRRHRRKSQRQDTHHGFQYRYSFVHKFSVSFTSLHHGQPVTAHHYRKLLSISI